MPELPELPEPQIPDPEIPDKTKTVHDKRSPAPIDKRGQDPIDKRGLAPSRHALRLARSPIAAITAILATSIIVGISWPDGFSHLLEELEGLAAEIKSRDFIGTVLFIFLNNLKAASVAVVTGPLFGIIPVLQTVANGVIIGVVVQRAAETAGVLMTMLALLPHGIFEIPAMLISWGLGLWLGLWPFNKNNIKFRTRVSMAARAWLRYVVPLLAAAALIEGALISALKGG